MIKKISIVIPVFNSHQYLYNFISNLILIVSKKFKNFEVILIDDCSSDDSWKVIEQLSLSFDKIIKAIQLRKNVGQHNAIFLGLKYCEGDIIITMDDDGQNSPDNIEEMIKKMENGYDVCYANYKIKKHNLFRRFGSYINNIFTSVLFKKPLSLILTSFRVFKKEIKDEILKYKSSYIYIDGLIFSITSNVSNIHVEHKPRNFGKSNYTFLKLLSLWIKMFISFSILPLRIASLLGIIFSISSFLAAVWLVFFREMSSDIPMGWTSLIVIILFLGGIQLLALGLIGEYLGSAYLSINNSSKFSEKKKLNIK
jgi:polyisoprenyl-phosphate glycosyltransferase